MSAVTKRNIVFWDDTIYSLVDAERSSETSVNILQTKHSSIQEGRTLLLTCSVHFFLFQKKLAIRITLDSISYFVVMFYVTWGGLIQR
jgi:hypothetical protein